MLHTWCRLAAAAALALLATTPADAQVGQHQGAGSAPGENPNEPPEMTPELWCAACHATVRESMRRMPAPKLVGEADVYAAFSKIDDDPFRFSSYAFSPPTIRYAVGRFLDEFEEVIDPKGAWEDGASLEEAFLTLHNQRVNPEEGICEALCKDVSFVPPEEREERLLEMQQQHRRQMARNKAKAARLAMEDVPPELEEEEVAQVEVGSDGEAGESRRSAKKRKANKAAEKEEPPPLDRRAIVARRARQEARTVGAPVMDL